MITPVWIVWTGTGDCHPISHPGLSVPNLDAAVAFYSGVLGFYVRMQPSTVTEDVSAIGVMCADVFGPCWDRLRIAHLSTGDGIELFEFAGSHAADDNFDFHRNGTFHCVIKDPDVEGLLARIVAAGGKQRMLVREYFPG